MAQFSPDIVIFGAGIAGLWTLNRLRLAGYDAILLTDKGIGHGQSLSSQGIIHSGLKYTLAGKVNKLAKTISVMPQRWIDSIYGKGDIDLTDTIIASQSQIMMIPSGFMGGIVKMLTQKTFSNDVHEIQLSDDLKNAGFDGSAIRMNEPVLDIPSVIHNLSTAHVGRIFQVEPHKVSFSKNADGLITAIKYEDTTLHPSHVLFTAAAGNKLYAEALGHEQTFETQKRPLQMGFMKPAPFELFAHFVGKSDKPVATITTHTDENGDMVWYFGGQVSERATSANASETIEACKNALAKYLPALDISAMEWSTLPINRVEGKCKKRGFMPDTPSIHHESNVTYAWPTKLTFAPMLADEIMAHYDHVNLPPSDTHENWSACTLPHASRSKPVWHNDAEESVWN